MKIKWNWGTKIAILYSSFVLFMLGMVYFSFIQKYDLVTENYYAKELTFQDKIDSRERYKNLNQEMQIVIEGNMLSIIFPHLDSEIIEGEIACFRPSDIDKDFNLAINPTTNKQSIPLNKFSKGKYLLKIDWKVANQEYYTERSIIIP